MTTNHLLNRLRMAERLFLFLSENSAGFATAESVALLSPARRAEIARMAGEKRTGSDETWAVAVDLFVASERRAVAS